MGCNEGVLDLLKGIRFYLCGGSGNKVVKVEGRK